MLIGSVVLFICIASCVLYDAGCGVKYVHVILSGLRMKLFLCSCIIFNVRMLECLCCYVLSMCVMMMSSCVFCEFYWCLFVLFLNVV